MVFDFGGRLRGPGSGSGDGPDIPFGGARNVTPLRPPRAGRPGWLIPALIIGALFALFILASTTAGFWVNLWWFESLGFRDVLLTRYEAQTLSFVAGFVVAALFLGVNVWLAMRADGGQALTVGGAEIGRSLSRAALVGGTLVLSFFFALGVGGEWETFLRFLNRTAFGVADPQFKQDVGFYVFTLPVIAFGRSWLMALIIFAAIAVAAIYAAKLGAELAAGQFRVPPHVRAHLSVLGALFLAANALGYWISTQELVYSTRGVVIGASYTDVNAQAPANYILLGISAVAALILLANAFARQLPLLIGALAVWGIAAILIGVGYPSAVQSLRVRPNELDKETPYIARNIEATRRAYNIGAAETVQLPGVGDPTRADITANASSVQNVRLWDYRPLLLSYGQSQQIRQYYQFTDVDVERYAIDGQYRQVMVSARELNPALLPAQSQTWQNQHLIYTHGYGAVASTANEVVGEGRPNFLLSNIPPQGPSSLAITEPRIYFGEVASTYVIVKSKQSEFDRPSGDNAQAQGEYTTYMGNTGVNIGSPLRRLMFTAYLGETKLLLSGDITGQSDILFQRNIAERLRAVAPFLRYDRDPYLSIVDGRLVWINDAYTVTSRYPYATRTAAQVNTISAAGPFNYIRNSVKATVDAYDGSVRLYIADPSDPLVQTYQHIYPSLFKPMDAASPALRAQFRYPEDYFDVQSALFTRYHVTDPRVFYGSEDQWAIANELVGPKKDVQQIEAYYVLLKLPGQQQDEFALVRPFTPGGSGANARQNMVAYLAGRSDGPNYGQLVSYEFPRQIAVQGPQQIEARINQEPDISKEVTLLDQSGSSVIFGNFLIIPVGNTLLYVEPLYVQATNSPFPELKRVIVASQNRVIMRNTLNEAIDALVGGAQTVVATPSAPGNTTFPAAMGDAQAQAQEALMHYQRAQDALRTGDWTTYGNELQQVQRILQQLGGIPAMGVPAGTATASPGGSPPRPTAAATPRP